VAIGVEALALMWRRKFNEDLTAFLNQPISGPKRRGPQPELSDPQLHTRREQLVQAFEGAWGEIGGGLRKCKKAADLIRIFSPLAESFIRDFIGMVCRASSEPVSAANLRKVRAETRALVEPFRNADESRRQALERLQRADWAVEQAPKTKLRMLKRERKKRRKEAWKTSLENRTLSDAVRRLEARLRNLEAPFARQEQSAYSAATLLAFGADEIVMHPNGHLGPVDMQITTNAGTGGQAKTFSTEDISAFLDFVRESLKITDQEHLRALFELTCKEVGTLGIGFTARSSKLALDLGERLLAMHMKEDEVGSKLRTIVQNMSKKFQSHGYPVNRKEALEIGLPAKKQRDKALEKMMWDVWLSIERDLNERTPFDFVVELLKSPSPTQLPGQSDGPPANHGAAPCAPTSPNTDEEGTEQPDEEAAFVGAVC